MALFETKAVTPHGFCLSWDTGLIALHVVSDSVIAIAYFTIPAALAWLVVRRRDLLFPWLFALFALFIMACGTTHLMDIWTLWHPDYWVQGVIKGITAMASIATAAALWPLLPELLKVPSPSMLREANDKLAIQLHERDHLLEALRHATVERERAEDMLRQAQKMEAIGQLTGGVAHDFNNLLMVMQANIELLQRRMPTESPMQTLLQRAMDASDRGAALTQQLLAFSRRQSLQPTMLDVDALVTRLEPMLTGTLSGSLRLELHLGAALASVEADGHQLENALLNLVINARDAMPRGGLLRIDTRIEHIGDLAPRDGLPPDLPPGLYVCIAVTDSGVGMTQAVQQAAFEPFFTTKPVGQGSGLGLSQVYGFVKQSHGHVSLNSQVGTGTIISLFLPATSRVGQSQHTDLQAADTSQAAD